jgi:molecular chaperone IbpA
MPTFCLNELLGSRYFNQAIGFDPFFKTIDSVLLNSSSPSYPPHDIINQKKGAYAITLALAGFDKEDLDVSIKEQTLTISSSVDNETNEEDILQYNHRGIAKRNFKKVFALGRHIEVDNVIFKNGLLTVHLKENLPEDAQTRQIKIMQI